MTPRANSVLLPQPELPVDATCLPSRSLTSTPHPCRLLRTRSAEAAVAGITLLKELAAHPTLRIRVAIGVRAGADADPRSYFHMLKCPL